MTQWYNVFPVNDIRPHIDNELCWCKPVVDDEEPTVLIHNAMDGREAFETGERKPS